MQKNLFLIFNIQLDSFATCLAFATPITNHLLMLICEKSCFLFPFFFFSSFSYFLSGSLSWGEGFDFSSIGVVSTFNSVVDSRTSSVALV